MGRLDEIDVVFCLPVEETVRRPFHADSIDDEPSGDRDPTVSYRTKKEEELIDDDEELLASEEGKMLSSKERRQLRNRISARAFRSRTKEYISQLDGEVAARAQECGELRSHNRILADPATLKLHYCSRPISPEQLATEVKGIYAGLQMVEQKCIQVIDNSPKPLVKDTPDWEALIALHRTLLHEHHDFLLASQHPATSKELRNLASKYVMPTRVWKPGEHSFLDPPHCTLIPKIFPHTHLHESYDVFQASHRTLPYEHHDLSPALQLTASKEFRALAWKYSMPARMWKHGIHNFSELVRRTLPGSHEYMFAFLILAYQMMGLLYETVPDFQETWIECLGDLGRYRMAIEDENSPVWTQVARYLNSKAANERPRTDRPYHHLAILSLTQPAQQSMLYSCGLTAEAPFLSASKLIDILVNPKIEHQGQLGSQFEPLDQIAGNDPQCLPDPDNPNFKVSHLAWACRNWGRTTFALSKVLRSLAAAFVTLFEFIGPKICVQKSQSIRGGRRARQPFLPGWLICELAVVLLFPQPAVAWPGEEHVVTQLDRLQAVFSTACVAAFSLCAMGVSAVSATIMGGGSLFWIVLVQSKDATRASLITTFSIWFFSNLAYIFNHWRVLQRNDPEYSTPRYIPWNLASTFLVATTAGAFALLWTVTIISPGMSSMPMPVGALVPFCVCLSSWFSSWIGWTSRSSGFPPEAPGDARPEVDDEVV